MTTLGHTDDFQINPDPYTYGVNVAEKDADRAALWLRERSIDYGRYGWSARPPTIRYIFKSKEDTLEFILRWA